MGRKEATDIELTNNTSTTTVRPPGVTNPERPGDDAAQRRAAEEPGNRME